MRAGAAWATPPTGWWLAAAPDLTGGELLTVPESDVPWKRAIKAGLGKLLVPDDLEGQIRTSGFFALPVDTAVAFSVSLLPPHHRDPSTGCSSRKRSATSSR